MSDNDLTNGQNDNGYIELSLMILREGLTDLMHEIKGLQVETVLLTDYCYYEGIIDGFKAIIMLINEVLNDTKTSLPGA